MKIVFKKEAYVSPEIDAMSILESGIICTSAGMTIDDTEDGYTL